MGYHPEGPGQAQEVGPRKPHEAQQGQLQGARSCTHVEATPNILESLRLEKASKIIKSNYQYRLGHKGIQSSPEQDLGVLVGENLDINQQCVLTAQKAIHILGCLNSSVASRR